jgi:hypothetical protein
MPKCRRRPSRDDVERIVMLLLRVAEEVIRLIEELRKAR